VPLKRRMKILQVCPIFPPQPANFASGVTQVVHYVSKELVKRGHRIEVWTANTLDLKAKIRDETALVDGIEVYYFPYLMHYYTSFLSLSLLQAARSRLNEFDVIHIHDFRTFQGAVVAHYAQKNGIPYLLQAHGSLPRMMAVPKLKQAYDILFGYKLLRDAAKVVAVTEIEAEQYKRIGISEDKVAIIPNGIDLYEFQNLPRRGQFREKYGLDANQKIILYLGRIHKIKGLDLLAKAFAELLKEVGDVKLIIAGYDDGYLPALKKITKELKIKESIVFTGPLYGRDKLEAYVDADIYVLPSRYEIFGITVLEACACGTSVVTIDTCGTANWVNDHCGYRVSYNVDELRRALLALITDEDLRKRLGQCGKELVAEQFAWGKIVVRLENLYHKIAGNLAVTT
jgi:glycosyltransferase involved in cell wall biosynthesis